MLALCSCRFWLCHAFVYAFARCGYETLLADRASILRDRDACRDWKNPRRKALLTAHRIPLVAPGQTNICIFYPSPSHTSCTAHFCLAVRTPATPSATPELKFAQNIRSNSRDRMVDSLQVGSKACSDTRLLGGGVDRDKDEAVMLAIFTSNCPCVRIAMRKSTATPASRTHKTRDRCS